jgi:predicted O-methyltransferase YrrM
MNVTVSLKRLENVLRNATRGGYFVPMAQKVVHRVDEAWRSVDRNAVRAWCEQRAEDVVEFGRSRSAELWDESQEFGQAFEREAEVKLRAAGVSMGGGGHYPLLYFLTRLLRPQVVIETGVAAGFTSAAFLQAMDRNESGRLYSSDFPYFRLPKPERYVGLLVDDRLKARWRLELLGDRENVPRLLAEAKRVDLLHYDSDKSYRGRRWVVERVTPLLNPGAIVVMDDIQDNWFFRDYTERTRRKFRVFEFHGKFAGLIEF